MSVGVSTPSSGIVWEILFVFRQQAELETQKQQNLNQVKKLKEETGKLQTHMDTLDTSVPPAPTGLHFCPVEGFSDEHFWFTLLSVCNVRVNEWRLKEHSQNASLYSFLHDTVFLQLVFPDSDGMSFCGLRGPHHPGSSTNVWLCFYRKWS